MSDLLNHINPTPREKELIRQYTTALESISKVAEERDHLRTQLKSLEGHCAVMREAFSWIEEYFRVNIDGGGRHSCPWCYHKKEDSQKWSEIKHDPNCLIGNALTTTINQLLEKREK